MPAREPSLDTALRRITGEPPANWVTAVAEDRPDLAARR
jgi:hypothetical protein